MKTNMQKYPAYKDSGVEWLGDIPMHWNTLSNKNIFKLKKNQVGNKSGDYVLLSLTLNGVIKRDMENPQGKFPAEFNTYQEVKKGDFIFCLFDVEETPRCVGLSDFDGMITGAYTVMEPNDNFDRKFLYYFYLNLDADKRLKPLYTGLRNTISKENFFSFKSFVPPLSEQTAIAEFLDRKTALIDHAFEIKQKQIELLKERRQILIHKSVTRGLNPNVKMKDSGVEWIGEIPEHWVVKKLTFVTSFITCGVASTPTYVDSEIGKPFLSAQNVRPFKMSYEKFNHIPIRLYKELTSIRKIEKGDLLMTRVGAGIGDVAIFNEDIDCAVYVSLTHIRVLNEVFNKYIMYFLGSYSAKLMHEEGTVHAGGQGNLNVNNLRKYRLPLPKIDEQKQIVEYIETSTTKIAIAITLKEQEIEKLKEYKATLINSAVTGKIKVY